MNAFAILLAVALPAVVLPDSPTAVEKSAATELADGVEHLLGRRPRTVAESAAPADAVRLYVGATKAAKAARGDRAWKTDEILVRSVKDGVVLDGDPARAPIYAVVEYLERFCGVRWWTSTEATYPKLDRLPTDGLDRSFAPPFVYRETYYLDGYDWRFKVRNRGNFTTLTRYMLTDLNFIPEEWGGNHRFYYYKGRRSAYHSFNEILPYAVHFKDHPDWYSMIDGERRAYTTGPDGRRHSTQLCLSNGEMKREYIRETIRRLGEDPGVDFISVTQNDCFHHCVCWCTCPECKKRMEADGGDPNGIYLRFVNEVAEAVEKVYPHVTVETLAYSFTRIPPKTVRPRKNVVVHLCCYECDFSTPFADGKHEINREFVRNLKDWTSLAPGQVIVMDYLAAYSNYVLPHPNIHPLERNVRLYRDCGATGVYSLGDAISSVGSFASLHHYLNAHLLWDPDRDGRALVDEFLHGYFGSAAAPYLAAYIELLEKTAVDKGALVHCWRRDKDFFITPDEALALSSLMRAARLAAEGESPDFARRVRREELSVDHLFILHWDEYRARAQATGTPWIRPGTRLAAVEEWEKGLAEYKALAWRETVDASDLPDYLARLKSEAATNAAPAVVGFKDAAKIKSWDAWDDHKKQPKIVSVLQKEKPKSAPWRKLNAMDLGLKEIGRLATRTSAEVRSSKWSVGCEAMDRDYAVWDNYKELLPMLGVKHARFFSGWAKTEQVRGVYDFAWLDAHLRECVAMKVKPWVCISYGNPVYGSDFRLGMRVSQVTRDKDALAAWLRYVRALVARYADIVDEWEVWNEPFDQGEDYATLFIETARAVREIQPSAQVFCTAMGTEDYRILLERLKRENALDLASYFIYHPYQPNPDETYDPARKQGWGAGALELRKMVKGYSEKFDVMQGETGCPSQLEFAHAMSGREWTEYSQAKWNLRRALGDAARSIPSSVFSLIDLQYTFMLQSFGLLRSDTLKEFVYRRPSWFAMRNVYALIDDDTPPTGVTTDGRLTRAEFVRDGRPLRFYWFSDAIPGDGLAFERVDLGVDVKDPVLVEMITGRVFELPSTASVPVWDSPVLVAERGSIPLVETKESK